MIDNRVFAKFSDRIMMYPILMEEIDELNNKVGSVKVSYALCRHYYDKGIEYKRTATNNNQIVGIGLFRN